MIIQKKAYQITCNIKNIINLSRQTNKSIPHKIKFVRKLEKYNDEKMLLLLKSSRKLY